MENIEVAVRVRPLNPKELTLQDDLAWTVERNQKTITMRGSPPKSPLILTQRNKSTSPLHQKKSYNNGQSLIGNNGKTTGGTTYMQHSELTAA